MVRAPLKRVLVPLLLALCIPLPAHAWGEKGHYLVEPAGSLHSSVRLDGGALVPVIEMSDTMARFGKWPGKVVTEVTQATEFWEAEPEHQDYLITYPNGYTCRFLRPDWVLPKRTATTA